MISLILCSIIGVLIIYVSLDHALRKDPFQNYTLEDAIQASERIYQQVMELPFLDRKGQRDKCKKIAKEMLFETRFMVSVACQCSAGEARNDPEIGRYTGEVLEEGINLLFYIQWTLLKLRFPPFHLKCLRRTLHATEKYVDMWLSLLKLYCARYPSCASPSPLHRSEEE
jgi:hypothetical protein